MKPLLLSATVLAVLFSSSCTARISEIKSCLKEAERFISIAPDSSLSIMTSIDMTQINGKKLKAEASLLHSIALDKCHIDLKSDSIIAPALIYFSEKGNLEKRSKACYYAARVYENAGNPEMAMEWLIRSEEDIEESTDVHFQALVYSSKGRIYHSLYEFTQAALNYSKASDLYIEAGDHDRFYASKLREITCLFQNGEYNKSLEAIEGIKNMRERMSIRTLAKYYPLMLNIYDQLQPDKVEGLLIEYLEAIGNDMMIDWLTVSRIYTRNSQPEKAIEALVNHKGNRGEDAVYHFRMAEALENLGRYSEALEAFRKYIELSGRIGNSIIDQDTRFIEERQLQLNKYEKAKDRNTILSLSIIVSLLALSLAILIIVIIRKQLMIKRNEHFLLQVQLDGLLQEREDLARTYTENEEGRRIISERLRIIDNFVFSTALQDDIFERKASETLKRLISDREGFIRQNRLIFNQSHPRFIEFLKTKELTDMEIEHCCLYAIGLNGKMVTNFTNIKRHYHIGSSIRKKMGLNEHDTNISIYIKKLLKEFE